MPPSKTHRSRVKRHGLERRTTYRRKAKEQTTNTNHHQEIQQDKSKFTVTASRPCSTTSRKPILSDIIPPVFTEEPSLNSYVCQTPDLDDIMNDAAKWFEH